MAVICMSAFESNVHEVIFDNLYLDDNFQDLSYDNKENDPSLKYYKKFKSKKYIKTKDLRKPQKKKMKNKKRLK